MKVSLKNLSESEITKISEISRKSTKNNVKHKYITLGIIDLAQKTLEKSLYILTNIRNSCEFL